MPGFRNKLKQLFRSNSTPKTSHSASRKDKPLRFPQGIHAASPPVTLNPLLNLNSLSLSSSKSTGKDKNIQKGSAKHKPESPPITYRKTLVQVAREGDLSAVQEHLNERHRTPDELHEALMAASACGQAKIIILLLQQDGIDINKRNARRQSPLERAVSGGHGWAVRVLVENGADPFLGSPSPLGWAEILWNARPLTLFQELVDERYPGKRLGMRAPQGLEDKANTAGSSISTARPPDPSHPPKNEGGQLWPDRILFRQGNKTVIQPSDPTYWN
ncbi:hypothetical protein FE257_002972 [Aspergillus nanangensis]|uniref:Ankyrin repeat protein n=1 Tax=Aspergillus nanangensis TaxID=2582783 RepID=A0AAD4CUH8_ASPNN|nr:hypothetical protein FE257_002972 [Aspergillus nanangensis]